ncbi:MAG: G8 domain-containing protein [Planctomycetota bacterium]
MRRNHSVYKATTSMMVACFFMTATVFFNGTHATAKSAINNNPMILALVPDSEATHIAIASGDWSNLATWQGASIPNENARVVIPSHVTVTVDTNLATNLKTVRVDGVLRFSTNQNTRLQVDTLVVTHMGHLEMGTAATPIESDVVAEIVFVDDGPIDLTWDPAQLSRGMLVMGSAEMHGADVTGFVALAAPPASGSTTIQLAQSPNGWKVGDQIVITGSQGVTSDEVRTINAINGSTISFDPPLSLNHIPPRSDINIYVANTTRNVQIRSQNTNVPHRGHIMLVHTLSVMMNNVGMYELGRTDKSRDLDDLEFEFFDGPAGNAGQAPIEFNLIQGPATNIRGRYALHFHRGGFNSPLPATVNGCVVFGSPGWGFVNHTGHVEFRSNVAYGVQGSAYYTETGDERGLFDGNISIRSFNPRDPVNVDDQAIDPDLGHFAQEFGNSGDGFWLSGHLVSVTNNVVSGASGHGIIIWSDGVCESDRGRTAIPVTDLENGHLITGRTEVPNWWAPLADIKNNECSNATIGFRTRYIHSQSYLGNGSSDYHRRPPQAYIDTLKPTIDGLLVWGCRDGTMFNYSERLRLKNFDIVGIGAEFIFNPGTANVGMGMDLATIFTRGPGRLENINIEGFHVGLVAPRHDQWTLENLILRNTTDILIEEARFAPRTLVFNNVNFGDLAGTAVEGAGDRENMLFLTEFDSFGQPFYFVMPDRITLEGQGIYFWQQEPDFVPLEELPSEEDLFIPIPEGYAGATNQELSDMFGLSFAGALLPEDAVEDPRVILGYIGPAAPPATVFPPLADMTGGGFLPEPFPGGPSPELTGLSMELCSGQTVTMIDSNFNTTDTNSSLADLRYTVSGISHGYFDNRMNPGVAITTFTQAEINGGVIRFVHDGGNTAPAFNALVSDGVTTTSTTQASVTFCDEGGIGGPLLGDINLDGTVNLLDVAPFVTLVSSGTFQVEGDLNSDGVVSLLDVEPFVSVLSGG